jgi:hypothetical protein
MPVRPAISVMCAWWWILTDRIKNGKSKPMTSVDIADLDCIYLSYDEPQREDFWVKIRHMIPWAKRVDGIKGSDAAHKAAAEASDTERFVLIDGDNLPDPCFFNLALEFPEPQWEQAVFRWRARNHVNGLMYGNGGVSSWTKAFVQNMRTHENTDGRDETVVEFCFDPMYWAMHDCYSTTYPNGSAHHAWRAGFREGVKMCLDKGRRPTVSEFRDRVHRRNLDHLTIWHNIGRDVEHGAWAMAGARHGTYRTMLTDWDYREVQSFDALEQIWQEVNFSDADSVAREHEEALRTQLDLPMCMMAPTQSHFFKHHYRSNWSNQGVMVREIDVIKRQEGW